MTRSFFWGALAAATAGLIAHAAIRHYGVDERWFNLPVFWGGMVLTILGIILSPRWWVLGLGAALLGSAWGGIMQGIDEKAAFIYTTVIVGGLLFCTAFTTQVVAHRRGRPIPKLLELLALLLLAALTPLAGIMALKTTHELWAGLILAALGLRRLCDHMLRNVRVGPPDPPSRRS